MWMESYAPYLLQVRMTAVLADPHFAADPIAAITSHILTSVAAVVPAADADMSGGQACPNGGAILQTRPSSLACQFVTTQTRYQLLLLGSAGGAGPICMCAPPMGYICMHAYVRESNGLWACPFDYNRSCSRKRIVYNYSIKLHLIKLTTARRVHEIATTNPAVIRSVYLYFAT